MMIFKSGEILLESNVSIASWPSRFLSGNQRAAERYDGGSHAENSCAGSTLENVPVTRLLDL